MSFKMNPIEIVTFSLLMDSLVNPIAALLLFTFCMKIGSYLCFCLVGFN
jgi:hypothetical protein